MESYSIYWIDSIFFGAIAQAIIEVVKPFTLRNQGEVNTTKKRLLQEINGNGKQVKNH